jgi:hypothetical protein
MVINSWKGFGLVVIAIHLNENGSVPRAGFDPAILVWTPCEHYDTDFSVCVRVRVCVL